MTNLTRDQFNRLNAILTRLAKAERFIKDETVAIARRENVASTTQHYVRPDGKALYEINKEIGSDLYSLYVARRELEVFLADARAAKAKGLAA